MSSLRICLLNEKLWGFAIFLSCLSTSGSVPAVRSSYYSSEYAFNRHSLLRFQNWFFGCETMGFHMFFLFL